MALDKRLFSNLSVAPYSAPNGAPVSSRNTRSGFSGSPFLSGLYALDGWFFRLRVVLPAPLSVAPEYRWTVRASVLHVKHLPEKRFRRPSPQRACTPRLNPGFLTFISTGSSMTGSRVPQSKCQRTTAFTFIIVNQL